MRFKLDENFGRRTLNIFQAAGHRRVPAENCLTGFDWIMPLDVKKLFNLIT
ncbi:MAG: hypothetical protein Q8M86_07380 [Syntrophales bacterium]|nr:hypothetical protein [Syntrophales bacterium]MDP3097752.1 hypothetical protein [Syntrophales bacterium]